MTWDDETRARAAGMKRAGMTNKQIAARLGTTASSVAHACSRIGAYRRLDHARGPYVTRDFPLGLRDTTTFDTAGEP